MAVPLCAQPVSVGVKVGVPFADPMGRYGESRPYTIGPTVEVRLPAGFAVEGSAIYRRLGQTTAFNYGPSPETTSTIVYRLRGNSWEFPLIGKYYFRGRRARWQPYLGTGWTLRTIGWNYKGSTTTTNTVGDRVVVPLDSSSRSPLNVGASAVAGVRLRAGRLSFLPEIRYTRWGIETPAFAPARRNEGGVFLGIRF